MEDQILLRLTSGDVNQVAGRVANYIDSGNRGYCIPMNVTKYSMSVTDLKLRRAIERATFVIPDGLPITWLARRVARRPVQRVTGVDLAQSCLNLASKRKWSVFLLGASEESVSRASDNLTYRFPGIPRIGYRNGYYDESEVAGIIETINAFDPDLLLLGMGLPQKEYFAVDHLDELSCRFCIAVGGAFDIWSGSKPRAPRCMQRFGMEWAYRSLSNYRKTYELFQYGRRFASDLIFARRPKIEII